ncbi:DUF2325 domain-containing protein [Phreatobacter sp. AB_2022a]|uniref:DUF2325 domain-containing protein n=1 Tax=Phreatobacter sp. AB_2022a TaxID=3003134 RepID=UPI002286F37C|nr:DUF2325 domain-containing protein [Phreatobacter sp. AB_2022a]MCZ0737586.1 DUF2325 domain-containing protein [Phreatobacter sp. AB_2022a]
MSSLTVLHRSPRVEPPSLADRLRPPAFGDEGPPSARRRKIWAISPHFHCSIIGTCLTAGELRQVFVKLGDADAGSASDHALHIRGVHAAGRQDLAGKLINKALDRRHEAALKRFGKATSTEGLREIWRKAFDDGDISGAYWAVLSHPAADRQLLHDAFGEVHMLSHLVGSANRIDIARLNRLERQLAERDDKIARQEARLRAAADERAVLQRRAEAGESELARLAIREQARAEAGRGLASATDRDEGSRAHADNLAERLKRAELRAAEAERLNRALSLREAEFRRELAALEAALQAGEGDTDDAPDLGGLTLLYVGGRPRLVDQLRALAATRGGLLLAHDGGVEDNVTLLPGLISQADLVLFPVDCISHLAAGLIKRHCREAGKAYRPLRSASLASFLTALAAIDHGRAAEHGTAVA